MRINTQNKAVWVWEIVEMNEKDREREGQSRITAKKNRKLGIIIKWE